MNIRCWVLLCVCVWGVQLAMRLLVVCMPAPGTACHTCSQTVSSLWPQLHLALSTRCLEAPPAPASILVLGPC